MQIAYGRGGWVQVTDPELTGPLYVRFLLTERGHPRITEVYLDGRGEVFGTQAREVLPVILAALEDVVLAEDRDWYTRSTRHIGPNLSLLAAFFKTTFGSRHGPKHWVEASFLAQQTGSGLPNPGRPQVNYSDLPPAVRLAAPEDGLTDVFLGHVATRYYQGAARRERPLLKNMAAEACVSPKTVQRWVYEARKRQIMDAGERGRRG